MHSLKQSLLVVSLLLMTVVTALAGPASPDPVEITQPDGSTITAQLRGDEFQGWTELAATGHTIIHNHATGFWEYAAINPDNTLRGSGVNVHPDGLNAPVTIPRGLRPPRKNDLAGQMNQTLKNINQQRLSGAPALGVSALSSAPAQGVSQSAAAPGDWTPVPVSGARKMLVILVSFADRTNTITPASWNSTIFDPAGKSVTKYYNDNSFNNLSVTPVSHSQAGNPVGIISVTVADNHPNSGSNDNYTTETTIINHALAQAAPFVNFAAYDTNNNGTIETSELLIYFIYSGYEASCSSKTPNIWAHAWGGPGVSVAGKNVVNWAINGELNDSSVQMPMGVIAHELGHQMGGLPDLYDVSGQNQGLGNFSLMAGGSWGYNTGEAGGTTPTVLDAWCREFLGWTTPLLPATGSTVNLPNSLAASNVTLKFLRPTVSSTEYFLAENRYPIGWDLGLKGLFNSSTWKGGMLLTHIDITAGTLGSNDINSYTVNSTTPGHQGVVPVQAKTSTCDMLLVGGSCRGKATTLFYQGNNSSWSPASSPNSNFYNATPTAFGLTNISSPATTMTMGFADTYSISGNAGVAGATLAYTDGSAKSVTSDGSGNYSLAVSYNWSGAVTITEPGYTFSPASMSYTNVLANQTAQNYTATPITYSISGNAGAAGATLSYTDTTAKSVIADVSGNYSLTVSYRWSGTVTPAKAGYTFSPASLSYSNVLANQSGQNYTVAPTTYTISGNAGVAGAIMSFTDTTVKSVTAGVSGNYSLTVSYNWSGTVSPNLSGYTFNPTNRGYSNVLANQSAQDYTASPITYAISGNTGTAGVTLSYTDGTAKSVTADSGGNYSLTVSYNWSGTVTPSLSGYTFNPANRGYSNVLANQLAMNYTATPITRTVSGNAGVGGASLGYSDGSVMNVTADSSGNYSLTVSYNWSGTVTPSKIGYTFGPVNRGYSNVVANQSGQNYTAVPTVIPVAIGAYYQGSWYLDINGTDAWEPGTDFIGSFGTADMIPVVGDWNGNGQTKVGAYISGTWFLDMNGNGIWDGEPTDRVVPDFGYAGALPVTGDWNGDGVTEIGVYDPNTSAWYLDMNGSYAWEGPPADTVVPNFGFSGCLPVVGDWNGSGRDKIGVYYQGEWFLDTNGNFAWDGSPIDTVVPNFGFAGGLPVAGDWSGSGVDNLGVYYNGQWFLDTNGNYAWDGTPTDTFVPNFGFAGALPVVGHW